VREEWKGVRIREPQEDRASRRSGQLLTYKSFAKGIANPTKSGVFQTKTRYACMKAGVKRRTATPLFIGRFILLRFVVDHIAQHREQH
jgi:hypothetical protein